MSKQQEFRKQTEEAKFEAFSLMCKKVAELEKENAELKEKLTAIRNAKDKYDMSKDKSIIKALGAEYTLFCDYVLKMKNKE